MAGTIRLLCFFWQLEDYFDLLVCGDWVAWARNHFPLLAKCFFTVWWPDSDVFRKDSSRNGQVFSFIRRNQTGLWKISYFVIAAFLFAAAARKRFSWPQVPFGKLRSRISPASSHKAKRGRLCTYTGPKLPVSPRMDLRKLSERKICTPFLFWDFNPITS
jgi:hypothetical protein